MRSLWAIARITLRGAVRSRVVLTLLLLLAAAVIGLPLTVQGDGTVGGKIHILVGFTLGAVSAILGLTALWTGCAAVSTEVADHRIHLLVTKPVRSIQIWLGKWVGLLILQAGLLTVSGALLFFLLHLATRPSALSPEQQIALREDVWVCRDSAFPEAPGFDAAFRAALQKWAQENSVDTPPDPVREAIRQQLESRAYLVAPGEARSWTVRLPFDPDPKEPILLQFRMIKSRLDLEPVAGVWVLGSPSAEKPVEIRGAWRPQQIITLKIPPNPALQSRDLVLGFINLDPTQATVLFDPDQKMELQLPYGTFEANLLRALLMLFFQLAFLTAIGLSSGTLFSFPVAALFACTLTLLLQMGGHLAYLAERSHAPGLGGRAGDDTARPEPSHGSRRPESGPASTGRTQSRTDRRQRKTDFLRHTGESFVLLLGLYGGALSLLSTAAFKRRELGAPL